MRQRASLVKRQRKRPGTFRIPGLCEQSLEGARLGAPFSRIQRTLAPIKAIARRNGPVHRHRCKQRDERDQPLWGSVGPNDVVRFHGDVLWFWSWLLRADFSMRADCKDSLRHRQPSRMKSPGHVASGKQQVAARPTAIGRWHRRGGGTAKLRTSDPSIRFAGPPLVPRPWSTGCGWTRSVQWLASGSTGLR